MSTTFTFTFEEISVKLDGRDKSVSGTVEIEIETDRRGRQIESVYPWGPMTITRMFDWETETDHPVDFDIPTTAASYKLIDDMIFELYERETLDRMREDA